MEALRQLPSVEHVLSDPACADLDADLVRRAIEVHRAALRDGAEPAADRTAETALIIDLARGLDTAPLRRVINATGVVVHTNLGRAPLAPEAAAAVAATAAGYADLELDLEIGRAHV